MRILSIENHRAIIEVEATELDNIINDYLDTQYKIGYEEGYNDWRKLSDADMDDDRAKNYSQERDKGII